MQRYYFDIGDTSRTGFGVVLDLVLLLIEFMLAQKVVDSFVVLGVG